MHGILVNSLGGLSLPKKSVVRLTDRPDMTITVYYGRKTTVQQQQDKTILIPKHTLPYLVSYKMGFSFTKQFQMSSKTDL